MSEPSERFGSGPLLADKSPSVGIEEDSANGNSASVGPNGHSGSKPEPLALQELKAILEAVLFVSHEPLSLDRLRSVAEGASKQELLEALRTLQQDYAVAGRGLQLVELAGGYQIMTRLDYAPWLKRLERTKPAPKLSRSALESLAIIAYKQPIVRAEIEHIRGVETSGVLRTLLERKLVRIVGRRDEPGRPILYGTTKYFLQHFGLRDLSDLPPLHEFKELRQPEQTDLPIAEDSLPLDGLSESDRSRATTDAAGLGDMSDYLASAPAEQA